MVEIPVAVPPPPSEAEPRPRRNRVLVTATALAACLGFAGGACLLARHVSGGSFEIVLGSRVQAPESSEIAASPADESATDGTVGTAESQPYDYEAIRALRTAMLEAAAQSPSGQFAAVPDPAPSPVEEVPAEAAEAPPPVADATLPVRTVPLPVARPPQFRNPVASEQPRPMRGARRAQVAAAAPAPMEDTRSFFEKFFGVQQPGTAQTPAQTPALAYASLETPAIKTPPPLVPAPSPTPPAASGGTAVYDITARTVTLPNGERLEAHSGLGEYMDNPSYVHVQMRGATPPGTYDLTEREAPFHGVRALRMTPIGGSAAIHGRAGLLAHTYMLRAQPGASNGCVVFRNYDRFLQAYLNGEIRRLVVVAGSGGGPLDFVKRLTGRSARLGSDG